MPLTIENARVPTADGGLCRLAVTIEGETIGSVAHGEGRRSAAGALVPQGIVDLHGDAFEQQMMPRPRNSGLPLIVPRSSRKRSTWT